MNDGRRPQRLRSSAIVLIGVILVFWTFSALYAQTGETGSIAGTVKGTDGSVLPGVTVTATAPVLMGTRTAISGANGDYVVRGLPPGDYSVRFELSGMASSSKKVNVELGGTARLDVVLGLAAKSEAIIVTAEAPTVLNTTQLGSNFKQETITQLPIQNRTLSNVAMLAPGVNGNTPNGGQVRINGAFAYDNTFLVDGTDIVDNLFANPNGLYIEDAIAETQVLTGGVSAEYGRFTGGVVNAISKSGGNTFAGSGRADYSKPSWTTLTPFERDRNSTKSHTLGKIYQGTFGGPVMRDRLWFFLAARNTKTNDSLALTDTGITIPTGTRNPRYEGKLTGAIGSNHTLQASYLTNNTTQIGNLPLGGYIDPRGAITRELPNSRYALFYNGVLSPSLFAEVKYSRKKFQFKNAGGSLTDIHESPFLAVTGPQRVYNAPYFDAHDPEDRNNNDATAALSYFLSTRNMGSHDFKAGVEFYRSTRTGGNSQSATGFRFFANPLRNSAGIPVTDANGRYIPVFVPCQGPNSASGVCTNSGVTILDNWLATRGAVVDLDDKAYYINDTWAFNKQWTFNIGGRFQSVTGNATGGIVTVDSSRFTPRLGVDFDVKADGRTKLDLTWGQYSGRYNERQFARNSPVGNPSLIRYLYTGPAGQGIDFAPAFDLNNYVIVTGSFPLLNIFVNKGIKSPVTDEWTFSVGQALSTKGLFKASFVDRNWKSFVEDFVGSDGFTSVQIPGTNIVRNLDNTVIGNQSSMKKKYRALQLLGQYRVLSHWQTQLDYTRELKNEGNFVGEAGNQPGNSSLFGDYPGLYDPNRHYPFGRLPGYERDRVRWLNTFTVPLSRFGRLDLGVVGNYDSPLTYNFSASSQAFTTQQRAIITANGWQSPPSSQTLFFGALGAGQFNSAKSIDGALTYSLPIFSAKVAPWVKIEMTNITNARSLIAWNTTIVPDPNSPKDSLGLATGFLRCGVDTPATTTGCGGAIFGAATAATSYQNPRTWDWAVGFRF